jgi:general secretion pathway protein A
MPDPKLLARYGLKYNPFIPSVPVEDLWAPPGADIFFFRVETLVMDGGFALITAEPGMCKSKVLQQLANRLAQIGDVVVGVMEHPQSKLGDMYREMGDLFGVDLSPANRYGGFKALRARFRNHIKSTLFRPVLLIDEAQSVDAQCLNELRILASAHFDSESLLTVVLCGDGRLATRFRSRDLLPLGSRIRTRLTLEPYPKDALHDFLDHILDRAGAPGLMTESLRDVVVDHAGGNPRVLVNMGAELLEAGAQRDLAALDEQLFLQVFSPKPAPSRRQAVKS